MNANLTALTSAVQGISSSIDAAVVALGTPADQPAIDALTTQLTDAKTKLDAALAPTP